MAGYRICIKNVQRCLKGKWKEVSPVGERGKTKEGRKEGRRGERSRENETSIERGELRSILLDFSHYMLTVELLSCLAVGQLSQELSLQVCHFLFSVVIMIALSEIIKHTAPMRP